MSNKQKLWQIGLIVFILGGLLNTVLMSATKIGGSDLIFGGKAGIGGLLRELSRFSVFVGLIILVIGLIRRKKSG